MKKLSTLFLSILFAVTGFAQATEASPQMADTMRSEGKIYVVVCVAAIVLTGLIVYLVSIDRKLGRLEKEMESTRNKNK